MPLFSYAQKSNPTKKETFDFIQYQCKFLNNPGFSPKQKLLSANYENLTMEIEEITLEAVITPSVKNIINLNDISEVKFYEDISNPKDIRYTVTIYFKTPYVIIKYGKDGSFNSTSDLMRFYFTTKGEAKKMYKALLHMESLVGVKKQLFSGD